MRNTIRWSLTGCLVLWASFALAIPAENPAQDFTETDLGLRPAPSEIVDVNPPDFAWGPQEGETRYRLELSGVKGFDKDVITLEETPYTIYRPRITLSAGQWYWRVRALTAGSVSRIYTFTVPIGAFEFPSPDSSQMLTRIPASHPRLLLRPEELESLRLAARGGLSAEWTFLRQRAEEALEHSLVDPVAEPEFDNSSKAIALWRKNYTICRETVYAGEILSFSYLISGESRYAEGAKRILHHILDWDPEGTTSMKTNDECGMPVLQYLPRMYDWLYDSLTPKERAAVVKNLTVRGREARHRLRNLQSRGYDSHGHRMFHQLAEAGIALYTEAPEASEWIRYALAIYHCWYPAWGDVDGGWSAGLSYYAGYVLMLTAWLDAAEAAMDLNPSLHPFVRHAGDFGIYLGPGGVFTQSFGDGAEVVDGSRMKPMLESLGLVLKRSDIAYLASQIDPSPRAGWFQVAPGKTRPQLFIRKALRGEIIPRPSSTLAPSKVFRGTGLAVLNSDIVDGHENVQVQFRASKLGTVSHMHSDQNAFLISAFGERMAIQSGFRPWYGSPFCKQYYWASRSKNTILVNGQGQVDRSLQAIGEITRHSFGQVIDIVEGHAEAAYGGRITEFSRVIVFVKPEWIVVLDRLEAVKPSVFTWQFHSQSPIQFDRNEFSTSGDVAALTGRLLPESLRLETTRGWPLKPERETSLGEQWHLAATSDERIGLLITAVMRVSRKEEQTAVWKARRKSGGELLIEDGRSSLLVMDSSGDVHVTLIRDGQVLEEASLSDH